MKNEALQPPVRHTSPVHDCDVELFQNNSTHYALQTLMCRTPDDYIHRKYEKKAPGLRILRRKSNFRSPQRTLQPQKCRKIRKKFDTRLEIGHDVENFNFQTTQAAATSSGKWFSASR